MVSAGQASMSVVSTVDIAPTILELAGVESPESFQGKSILPILKDPQAELRKYAMAEHNWHDYRAFERGVLGRHFAYVRNWLPATPSTPPADAVKSPTYRSMLELEEEGKLTEAQAACMKTPREEEFLFDIEKDADCLHNLAGSPAMQANLVEMRTALQDWQAKTNDAFPGEENLTPDGFDRVTGERIIDRAHPSLSK